MTSLIERAADRLHWEITNEGRSVDMAEAKAIVRIVLAAIREPSEEFAAALACALADTAATDGYAEVSGANQEQGARMAAWMQERGFTMVKYPRDMLIDAATREGG